MAVALLSACEGARVAPPTESPVSRVLVEGRVEDENGRGVPGVFLNLYDTSRLSGHVDRRGCGTYPQVSAQTDATGRFSVTATFHPNGVQVSSNQPWLELPRGMVDVTPGAPIVVRVHTVPHVTLRGLVVDGEGAPVKGATVQPMQPGMGARTDEAGRFELEVAEPPPETFRVRRMGYRPVVVGTVGLDRVVLASRRQMLTVTVLEPGSRAPVSRLVRVEAWQGGERLSFCTAGDTTYTGEPTVGACSLDAEPGAVDVRVEGGAVAQVTVGEGPLALSVVGPPAPPPLAPGDNGY